MAAKKGGMSPAIRAIRGLKLGPWYTTREAADLIGTTEASLRRWMHRDHLKYGPSGQVFLRSMRIYVYNDEDIQRARGWYELARRAQPGRHTGRRGRVKMWTLEESLDRSRRSSQASYYRRHSRTCAARGDVDLAIDAMAMASAITTQLREEHEDRLTAIAARMG